MSDDLRSHLEEIAQDRPSADALRARLAAQQRRRTRPALLIAASIAVVMVMAVGIWLVTSSLRSGPPSPASSGELHGSPAASSTPGPQPTLRSSSSSPAPSFTSPAASSARDPSIEPAQPTPAAVASTVALPPDIQSAFCFQNAASAAAGPETQSSERSYGVAFADRADQPLPSHAIEEWQEACRYSMTGERGWIQPDDPLVGCLTSDGKLYIVPGTADGAVCAGLNLAVVSPST